MVIGIYGLVNAGKSTLMNLLCGQEVSIVDGAEGTTTDTVRKRVEFLNYGAVTLIDTAGLDDSTPLADKRLAATRDTLEQIDLALVVTRTAAGLSAVERDFLVELGDTPYIIIDSLAMPSRDEAIAQIAEAVPASTLALPPFFGAQLKGGETVILVCPIDSAAPAGRLILPQVQAVRAALDLGATAIVVQPAGLADVLAAHNSPTCSSELSSKTSSTCSPELSPKTSPTCSPAEVERSVALVVTDSQVFDLVAKIVADRVPLTSFSILLSAQKADPEFYERGLEALPNLKKGDRILILENCSHQVNCEDIGRVKIPALLDKRVGGALRYTFVTGREAMPSDLSGYRFAVQCGGCMTTRGHLMQRVRRLRGAGVPTTNYGMLLRLLL